MRADARDKPDPGACVPVCDRVEQPPRRGQSRVYLEGDDGIRPAQVRTGDHHALLPATGVELVDGAENDVALEDREIVDRRVAQFAHPVRHAADGGGARLRTGTDFTDGVDVGGVSNGDVDDHGGRACCVGVDDGGIRRPSGESVARRTSDARE
ncbi:hypothetical protein ACIO14_19765 [Nocardia fluminea]|uniref:hypothetical protein n=1 Tax=Nocardia fluminea TaxID=134984 RepID=UPI0038055810